MLGEVWYSKQPTRSDSNGVRRNSCVGFVPQLAVSQLDRMQERPWAGRSVWRSTECRGLLSTTSLRIVFRALRTLEKET